MLGIPESYVPQALLLWGTRNLKTRYTTMRQHFNNVLQIGSPNGLLEDVFIGTLGENCVAYASVYGAPMASEIVHLFGVLGAHLVIQIGTCGGFGKGLKAGDLFVVDEAYCGEGASQYYRAMGKTVSATVGFTEGSMTNSYGVHIEHGRIYTTSALFAESREDIRNWARQGFSAVDMETAATFAVAEHFGMARGSILTVFDNPLGEGHILTAIAEKDERRGAAQKAMIELAFSSIENHLKTGSEPGTPTDG